MTSNDSRPTRWAIIIGIDYYRSKALDGTIQDESLQGCVKDALAVKDYLEGDSYQRSSNIQLLTASKPSSGCLPPEQPEQWPTFENFASCLRRTVGGAKPGDLVYFYYTGHGSQVPVSGQSVSELALVLFASDAGSKYLRGSELATVWKLMVDKGLIVTLVLDCCYSGNVARHDGIDFAIRGIEYNPNIPIVESEILVENSISSSSRLARVVNDWLVDPAGYTILSACGPYELAYEVNITGQGRFGSLTYYLLRTLRALKTEGESITHQSLHERLRAEFRESWPRQTPMRYGNKHLSFFGTLIDAHEPASVSVYRTKDRICIAAGQVHGINEGDEFALLPFGESQQVAEQRRRVMKVRTVRPFESELDAIRPESEQTTEIVTGWKAKLITASHARKVRVKLEATIDNKHLWKDASQKLPYSHVGTEEEGEDYIFNVVINKKGEYAVLDALHQGDLGLPTVPVNAPNAMAKVLRIVDHITTYKYLEGVNNPFPEKSFQALFSVTSPSTVDSSGVYAVSHGDTWRFTVKNTRRKPLFMTVYNFTSEWAVTNLISETGGDSYCVIPPPRNSETEYVEEIPLDMEVPEGTRGGLCKDILKVFITSKPVSFPTQILPDMPRYVDDLDHDVNGMDFFKESETHDRGVETDDDGIGDEWVTHNFVIQTTSKSYR